MEPCSDVEAPRLPTVLTLTMRFPDDYEELSDAKYMRVDLAGAKALCPEFVGVRFDGVSMDSVIVTRGTLRDVEFASTSLLGTALHECGLRRVSFLDSRMNSADFAGSRLADVVFVRDQLELANFGAATMECVRFEDSRLRGASFRGADLRGAIFDACDLTGAVFDGARMAGARLAGCNLTDISGIESLRGAHIPAADVMALAHSLAGVLGIVLD